MIQIPKSILFPYRVYYMALHIVELTRRWGMCSITNVKFKERTNHRDQELGKRVEWFLGCAFLFSLGQFKLHKYLSNACYVFINLFFFPVSELDTEFAWGSGRMPQEFLSPSSSSVGWWLLPIGYLEQHEIFWEHLIKHILRLLCWNHCKVFYLLLLQVFLLQN